MAMQSVPAAVSKTAFSCLHCGAFTSQTWFALLATPITDEPRTPLFPGTDSLAKIESNSKFTREMKETLREHVALLNSARVFFDTRDNSEYSRLVVHNLHLSQCFNCKEIAVWAHAQPVSPSGPTPVLPNADLPEDIAQDFREAASIVGLSPRGAAALARLCIQRLCLYLGENGASIDADIARLLQKGLNPLVGQALDIVRVVGNESVHPGEMSLSDDRDTALKVLELVNSIADQMISHPKTVSALYGGLPETKRHAIDARNRKALDTTDSGREQVQ